MGFMDVFNAEDRITLPVSKFGELVKEAAKAELIMNAVNCDVPHIFIRETITGEKEDINELFDQLFEFMEEEDGETEEQLRSDPVPEGEHGGEGDPV